MECSFRSVQATGVRRSKLAAIGRDEPEMDGVGGDAARAAFQLNGNAGEVSNGTYSALAGN